MSIITSKILIFSNNNFFYFLFFPKRSYPLNTECSDSITLLHASTVITTVVQVDRR